MSADGLLTVHEYAIKYGVDDETVRRWMRIGTIPYKMVGTRKMIRVDECVVPIKPVHPDTERAILILVWREGLAEGVARTHVESMSGQDIDRLIRAYNQFDQRIKEALNGGLLRGGEKEGAADGAGHPEVPTGDAGVQTARPAAGNPARLEGRSGGKRDRHNRR